MGFFTSVGVPRIGHHDYDGEAGHSLRTSAKILMAIESERARCVSSGREARPDPPFRRILIRTALEKIEMRNE
jgi:hypothetical protein